MDTLPASAVSRQQAVDLLAPHVYPGIDTKTARKRVQAAITYAIKSGDLPVPESGGWDSAVIFGWAAWMAETSHTRANRACWGNLRRVPGLPKAAPPRSRKISTGTATAPTVLYVVPSTEDALRDELKKAWDRVRELQPLEERHQQRVKNGKQHGPKGGRPKKL